MQEGTQERPRGEHVALVGRDAELGDLRPLLAGARGRTGHLVELVGEPGIGKTRLLEALEEEAEDFVLLPAACELYAATTAYHPFRGLLRRLIGISGASTDEEVLDRLRTLTAVNAPACSRGCRCSPPCSTSRRRPRRRRPRWRRSSGVPGWSRRSSTSSPRCCPTPTLLAIEDAQWMDEASAGLLAHLTTRLATLPWLVVVTRRDAADAFVAPPGDANVTTLRVGPLEADAATRLVRVLSAQEPLRPHVEAAVVDRAGRQPALPGRARRGRAARRIWTSCRDRSRGS